MSPINYSQVSHRKLKNRSCAEILVEYLKLEGVRYVFGVPGGTVVPILEAIHSSSEIDFIVARHESGAAFMADMYARTSGKLGVCLSTAGPGATNMLTGVACAQRDGVPLLAITGQPATHTLGKGAVQESSGFGVDTVGIYRNTCGFSALISEPAVFRQMVTTALRKTLSAHHQAAHLSIPSNISSFRFDEYDMPADTRKYRIENLAFDPRSIDRATELILHSQKMAILLGSGFRGEKSQNNLIELAECLHCPVMTSPQGKGRFPEDHPLSLGVYGFAGAPAARDFLIDEEVELLIVIGSRLDEWSTNAWDSRLHPEKYLIQIDSDSLNIGKNFPVSLGLVGNVARIVQELNNRIQQVYELRNHDCIWKDKRQQFLEDFRSRRPVHEEVKSSPDLEGMIKPQDLFNTLSRALPMRCTFISDAGNSYAWSIRHLEISPPQRYLIGLGFASMGHGCGGAPGAKLGDPHRPVIVVSGDGSMLMNGGEIHTAVQYGIPLLWIVLNDNRLGMVHHGMLALTGESIAAQYNAPVDFAGYARSLGALGERVERIEEVQPAIERLISSGRPALLDVQIDPHEAPPFLERIKGLKKYTQ